MDYRIRVNSDEEDELMAALKMHNLQPYDVVGLSDSCTMYVTISDPEIAIIFKLKYTSTMTVNQFTDLVMQSVKDRS